MSLQGKNVIVVGATSGFGASIAAVLSAEGANVFIGGRRSEKGLKVAQETKTTFHEVNVVDQKSNEDFFSAAQQHFGGSQKVDFILLNAGVVGDPKKMMISNIDIETYDYVFSINVRGVMFGLKFGAPQLRKGGSFIVTSSSSSVMSFGGNPIYAASKAAVDTLVRSYAAQFADSDDERIKSFSIVSVNPALYLTELSDRAIGGNLERMEGFAKIVNPSQRVGKSEELAVILRDYIRGDLPYKSGDNFAADADTHFPLNEYMDRLKAARSVSSGDA